MQRKSAANDYTCPCKVIGAPHGTFCYERHSCILGLSADAVPEASYLPEWFCTVHLTTCASSDTPKEGLKAVGCRYLGFALPERKHFCDIIHREAWKFRHGLSDVSQSKNSRSIAVNSYTKGLHSAGMWNLSSNNHGDIEKNSNYSNCFTVSLTLVWRSINIFMFSFSFIYMAVL